MCCVRAGVVVFPDESDSGIGVDSFVPLVHMERSGKSSRAHSKMVTANRFPGETDGFVDNPFAVPH